MLFVHGFAASASNEHWCISCALWQRRRAWPTSCLPCMPSTSSGSATQRSWAVDTQVRPPCAQQASPKAPDACARCIVPRSRPWPHPQRTPPPYPQHQYLWKRIVDFGARCWAALTRSMRQLDGGGLSAGAAAALGEQCKGVVLCNTRACSPRATSTSRARASRQHVADETLEGRASHTAGAPARQPALDLFGALIIAAIYPQIEPRLGSIYADRPANADAALVAARGREQPGSANVIGSGQKLATNRPLNEVLSAQFGFGGPVLVAQGLNDRVSGPARARERADAFDTMRDGFRVERIEGGHCVQDDSPDAVARALLRWLPQVQAGKPRVSMAIGYAPLCAPRAGAVLTCSPVIVPRCGTCWAT